MSNMKNFLGVNNRKPDFSLRVSTSRLNGYYIRRAHNVDVDNAGNLRRKGGKTLVQAMTGAHSIFLTSPTSGFIVRSNVLYAITLPTYSETLLKVLSTDDPMTYEVCNEHVFYSNNTDIGRITDGVVYPAALPTPDAPLVVQTTGTLLKGDYLVGVSYFNSVTGEEGSTSPLSKITLAATGGVTVTLPSVSPSATHAKVYITATNGKVCLLVDTVLLGTSTYDCTTLAVGAEAPHQNEAPLPPGTLFEHNGRLCSHNGAVVFIGLPYRYGYYNPLSGYILFPENVSVAISNQNGVYLAADKTYWVPGDLGDVKEKISDVLPYGAVTGTKFITTDRSTVGWFGEKGFVLGSTSGEVEAVMTENVDVTPPSVGFTTLLETDGYSRVHSCGYTLNLENNAASTYDDESTSASLGYATTPDGLYALSGSSLTAWEIGLGRQNFGSDALKHLPNIYLSLESEDVVEATVRLPNGDEYVYPARSSDVAMKTQRVDPGKGLRATWYDIVLSDLLGGEFLLSDVSFDVPNTKRRI